MHTHNDDGCDGTNYYGDGCAAEHGHTRDLDGRCHDGCPHPVHRAGFDTSRYDPGNGTGAAYLPADILRGDHHLDHAV